MNTKKLFVYSLICKFLPPSQCNNFKAKMLRWCGAKVGNNVEIMSGSKIILEDFCKIGSRVIIVTGSHVFTTDGNCIEGEGIYADVRICKGAAVSTASIILPGKTVNTMAHVAAGSVVTHDVPQYTRVAGIPAKVIKVFDTTNLKSN